MPETRTVKARCRCGKVLTIHEGPNGFKAVCPDCGAVVRIGHAPPRPTDQRRRKTIAVMCICGHVFSSSSRRIGHRVRCPSCGDLFVVPPPGERLLDMYHTQRLDMTDELPVFPGELPPEDPKPGPSPPKTRRPKSK